MKTGPAARCDAMQCDIRIMNMYVERKRNRNRVRSGCGHYGQVISGRMWVQSRFPVSERGDYRDLLGLGALADEQSTTYTEDECYDALDSALCVIPTVWL